MNMKTVHVIAAAASAVAAVCNIILMILPYRWHGQEVAISPENLIRAIVRSTTDDMQPDRSL